MCIIAIKSAKQKPFTEEMIRTMFTNNPDGAGYMTVENGKVSIKKGYMQVSHLIASLASVSPNSPVILHCRIATHGEVVQGLCHPFPVVNDFAKMRAKKTKTNIGVAHNGIISCVGSSHNVSDTMTYIQSVIHPLLALNEHALQSQAGKSILATTCESKLAFMESNGRITTIGDFVSHDGYLFSNGSYLERVWLPAKSTNFFTQHSGYSTAFSDDESTMLPLMTLDYDYKIKASDGTIIVGEPWDYALSATGGVYKVHPNGFCVTHVPNATAHNLLTGEPVEYENDECEMYELW